MRASAGSRRRAAHGPPLALRMAQADATGARQRAPAALSCRHSGLAARWPDWRARVLWRARAV
ncbi:hypothetical protein PSAC2689_130164 [Paraburkholderia sacchari]